MEKTAIKQTFISDVISTGGTPDRSAPVRLSYQQQANVPRPNKYVHSISDISAAPRQPQKQYARFYRVPVSTPQQSRAHTQTHIPQAHSISQQTLVQQPQSVHFAHAAVASSRVQHPAMDRLSETRHKPSMQAAESTGKPKKLKKIRNKRIVVANSVIVLALTMSGVLGFMSYKYHTAVKKVESQTSEQESTENSDVLGANTDEDLSTGLLSEDANGAMTASSGSRGGVSATARPYKLSIPKLGVSGSIISVGVTKSGAIGVPGNIWQVGWYKTSARPIDNTGVVILNGHVHGPTKPGIFANLKNLNPGDKVSVTDTNGTVYTYKVIEKKTYKANDGDPSMYQSASPDKQGLNLVTCDGKIVDDKYQDRLVVYTERI